LHLAVFVTLASGSPKAAEMSCPEILKEVEETYRNLTSYELV